MADPFQRYRGLEIAADAPRARERAEVPYHAVGDLELDQRSTAAGFARLAHAAIDAALRRGRVPVVSGGTGLYLRAALAELGFPEEAGRSRAVGRERLAGATRPAALARAGRARPGGGRARRRRQPAPRWRARWRWPAGGRARPDAGSCGRPGRAGRPCSWPHPPARGARPAHRRRVRRELDDGLVAELRPPWTRPGVSREAAR